MARSSPQCARPFDTTVGRAIPCRLAAEASKAAPTTRAGSSTTIPSPTMPASLSRPDRKRTACADTDSWNSLYPHKRQQIPDEPNPHAPCRNPRSPSKISSRIAARKVENTGNIKHAVEYVVDPNSTSRAWGVRRNPLHAWQLFRCLFQRSMRLVGGGMGPNT
ncbi:hypothetical protein BKA66DRAFT_446998 [Pyrenochaeta sp. MPI-SDFR-AT-0127]|nr:hypothetical protein BKA66DRAFT_446998 [Pyrenochaeta sp. MPI-SDFR-AT-0127]